MSWLLRSAAEFLSNERAVANASRLLDQRMSEDRAVLALVDRIPHDATHAA